MVGIALEGGGARGSYQVGAYLALIKHGVKPDMIAGTSIGAVNAALMVQEDHKKMVDLWLNTTTDILGINSKLIDNIKKKEFHKEDLKLGIDNLITIVKNKGVDTSELLKAIEDNIDEEKLRRSKINFGLVTVRVKGLKPVQLTLDDIPLGKVAEYILASCYLPIFSFKKIIDDNYYLDGGFYNVLPLSFLEKEGCNKIYAIRIKGIGLQQKTVNEDTEIIEIKPKRSLGSMIIFDKESNSKHLKMGYYDALKVIKNLDGEDYYFYNKNDRYYHRLIRKVDKDILSRLKMKYKTDDSKIIVIKIMEFLFKEFDYEEFNIYNIKKEIRYMRKYNLVIDPLYKSFIDNCKML
ncbi:MAG: patatin-like phospholipase family protein [Bacilli bacterium]|nr:patatin-like phospholipase family protein [Bacilli bacterium]